MRRRLGRCAAKPSLLVSRQCPPALDEGLIHAVRVPLSPASASRCAGETASLVMCGVLAHLLNPMPGANGPARSALPVPLTNPSRMVSGGALREFGSAGSVARWVVAVSIDTISQHCAGCCPSEAKVSATRRQVTNRSDDQDRPIDRVRSEAFAAAVVLPDDHTRGPGLPADHPPRAAYGKRRQCGPASTGTPPAADRLVPGRIQS